MLHTYLLTGSDALVNLVQWSAAAGCILGVSLIAGRLGGAPAVQVFAATVAATIPNAVCAASGSKNDFVVAYWIVLAVYLLLVYAQTQTANVAAALGVTIGLAARTKGTAYLFLPALLGAGFLMLSSAARRRLLVQLPLILVCAAALNAPQFQRNYRLSGSILGFSSNDGEGHYPWRNAKVTPSGVVGNVVRNLACNFSTRSQSLNDKIVDRLGAFLRKIGSDPNDPATTWVGTKFEIFTLSPHEIFAGNPLHLLLLFCSLLAVCAGWRCAPSARLYFLGIVGSFLTLCLLLRYQPWNQRLQLPLFVLASVPIAAWLSSFKAKVIPLAAGFALLLIAVPFALLNHLRPIVGGFGPHASIFKMPRDEAYFLDQHENLARDHIAAAEFVTSRGCPVAAVDAWE
jgi:4-amino-4-deoxy-L-arabinose transferase-like glycosyltransferase